MNNQENSEQVIEEAEKLIWALLDDRIDEADTQRLENLLKDNQQVRDRYQEISQIHSNLYEHFGNDSTKNQSPILSFLGDFDNPTLNNTPQAD